MAPKKVPVLKKQTDNSRAEKAARRAEEENELQKKGTNMNLCFMVNKHVEQKELAKKRQLEPSLSSGEPAKKRQAEQLSAVVKTEETDRPIIAYTTVEDPPILDANTSTINEVPDIEMPALVHFSPIPEKRTTENTLVIHTAEIHRQAVLHEQPLIFQSMQREDNQPVLSSGQLDMRPRKTRRTLSAPPVAPGRVPKLDTNGAPLIRRPHGLCNMHCWTAVQFYKWAAIIFAEDDVFLNDLDKVDLKGHDFFNSVVNGTSENWRLDEAKIKKLKYFAAAVINRHNCYFD